MKIIYSELTYKIIGDLYKVYNELGYGYREKHYQKALATEFNNHQITFKREIPSITNYNDVPLAKYLLDFLIEDKVILELKVADGFYKSHISQILSYLKSSGLRLGLLAIIAPEGIKVKRIIN